jgi:hypothetical protein
MVSVSYRSTHTSASFPQVEQVPDPLIRELVWLWLGSIRAPGSGPAVSVSWRVQVTTISASLPQFSHLQTCLTFFMVSRMAISRNGTLSWATQQSISND